MSEEEQRSGQTGGEQGGQDPDTPGREAEDVSGSSSEQGGSSDQPQTQEELRARLEEQLRRLRIQDLLVESVVSVLNLTARRIAKEDERDLEQARVGIEAIRAWVDLLPEEAATQIRNALSELQVLYAQAAEGGEAGEGGGPGEPGGGGDPLAGPAEQPPRTSGEPPPRLWTPPSSN
jgi:hypothetical protein